MGESRASHSRADRLRPSLCAEPPPLGLCCRATMATQAMQATQLWRMVWPTTMHWPTGCTLPRWVPSRYLAKVLLLPLFWLHEAAGRACFALLPLAGCTNHCNSRCLDPSCFAGPGYLVNGIF